MDADGGSIIIDTESNDLYNLINTKLDDYKDGQPIKEYLRNIWFNHFITDPNGLLFNEVTDDGLNTYPTYKSIFSINKMEVRGVQPEYIVFEPHLVLNSNESAYSKGVNNTDDKKEEILWVVDDAYYYKVSRSGGTARIIEKKINTFGKV